MQYDMLEMEAKSWHEKKVYANELLVSFEMLKIAQQFSGRKWYLSRAIEGMQNSLKFGAKPGVDDVREITEAIDELDKTYSIEVRRLKDLLTSSRNETD